WNALGHSPGFGTALAVFDDGTGPALCAAGELPTGPPRYAVARWSGTAWVQVGQTFDGPVKTLYAFDDDGPGPSPPSLYAGLWNYPRNVARWDGQHWQFVGVQTSLLDVRAFAT